MTWFWGYFISGLVMVFFRKVVAFFFRRERIKELVFCFSREEEGRVVVSF